ncbi:hypothetical protein [uncultured Shewanella sp.]|uniref:hypothetical protein n=1 Tax=Shewanella atlantica TaxID=271099 RepID=UPI00262A5BC4|nr:hypothetical protein [uncultured Shewanella sp.]
MRNISIDLYKLISSCLLFLLFSTLVTVGFVVSVTGGVSHLFQLDVHLSGIEMAISLVMFISLPFLFGRFCYYFYQMVKRGRRFGIAVFCYQNLFNPFNFLLFPSLLNSDGHESRRRCLVSAILLICIYALVFLAGT